MQISAEIRWFWPDRPPALVREWFCGREHFRFPAGGGKKSRTDSYLRDPKGTELGLKCRASKGSEVEVKGLVATPGPLAEGLLSGPIELWTKWVSSALTEKSLEAGPNGTVSMDKLRSLRKYDTSGGRPEEVQVGDDEKAAGGRTLTRGCNVELTDITLKSGSVWASFGFEAFGALETVVVDMRSVASLLAESFPAGVSMGQLASYPTWLQKLTEGDLG